MHAHKVTTYNTLHSVWIASCTCGAIDTGSSVRSAESGLLGLHLAINA